MKMIGSKIEHPILVTLAALVLVFSAVGVEQAAAQEGLPRTGALITHPTNVTNAAAALILMKVLPDNWRSATPLPSLAGILAAGTAGECELQTIRPWSRQHDSSAALGDYVSF